MVRSDGFVWIHQKVEANNNHGFCSVSYLLNLQLDINHICTEFCSIWDAHLMSINN